MKRLSNECNKYLKKVRIAIPSTVLNKKQLMQQLKNALSDYSLEHPEPKYEELISHFGEPKDIYNLTFTTEDIISTRKKIICRRIVICVSILLLFVFTTFIAIHVYDELNTQDVHGETTLEDLGDIE